MGDHGAGHRNLRLQPNGCDDWLLRARACRDQETDDAREATDRVITMLEADGGEFLTFAWQPRAEALSTIAA